MSTKLGIKINKLRKDKGFTLDGLAEKAGLSKSYLWELENRDSLNPSIEKLTSLAKYLDVTVGYFLEDSDSNEPSEDHLDQAFFKNYQNLDATEKEQLRKIAEVFKKS